MKTYIRRREKNNKLIVFYGGWGTDENIFLPLSSDEFDLILFYNYSADEPLILPETKTYEKIILIAWSLGVWAAEYLLPKTGIKPDVTIAVNGTPIPADERFGIPLRVIEGTLNNITEENISKFYLRMFGSKKVFTDNIDRMPKRTLKSLHDELRWMYNRIMEQKAPGFKWDYALTSIHDRVYPSKKLEDYWRTQTCTSHIRLPLPHYSFHMWNSFLEFASFIESANSKFITHNKKETRLVKDL
jgi:pimeloyl-[acyl-carrier protein] methyl ester esterase